MSRKKTFMVTQTVVTCLIVLFASTFVHGESLQEEVDTLSGHTLEADSLSMDRLQEFLTECDQLQKKIAASDDEKKKLLMFRLKKNCDFFAYIVELKKVKNSSNSK